MLDAGKPVLGARDVATTQDGLFVTCKRVKVLQERQPDFVPERMYDPTKDQQRREHGKWNMNGTHRQSGTLFARLSALFLVAPGLGAQQTTVIEGDASYCDCQITFEHVIRLGEFDGPGGLPGAIRQVMIRPDGSYFVVPYVGYQIFRFDEDGRPFEPFGREGEGPGETKLILHLASFGDTIVSFDPTNVRVTTFDGEYQVLQTARLSGGVFDAVMLPDRAMIVNGEFQEPQAFGLPLHLLSPAGARLKSFGGDGVARVDAPLLWRRKIATDGEHVWSSFDNQYVIERWSGGGELLHIVERVTEWFQPYLTHGWGGPDEPMDPRVEDLTVDGRGYLRTLVIRASPRWAELLPPPVMTPVGMRYLIEAGTGLGETVVEIIDPTNGRLIAAGVFNGELYGFVDADHVFTNVQDDIGVLYVDVWRLRLTRN
jgi:hypothetical protein